MVDVKKFIGTCNTYYIPKLKVLIDAGARVDEDVEVIILTHCHYDHLTFINEYSAKIYVGEKDRRAVEEMNEKTLYYFSHKKLKPVKAEGLKEGDEVRGIKVFETPGHTAGSISLLWKDYLFSGDTLFDIGVGRTDLPSGNYNELLKSLEKIKKINYNHLMPGH